MEKEEFLNGFLERLSEAIEEAESLGAEGKEILSEAEFEEFSEAFSSLFSEFEKKAEAIEKELKKKWKL